MRRCYHIVALAAAMATGAPAQQVERVPETIHSEGSGKADVCGLSAATVAALEAQVRSRADVEALDRTPEYVAYAIGDMRQLTFTTPRNRAHPAVVCRQVQAAAGGGSTIQTSVACFNSRDHCDWLYREFEALTKKMTDAVNGGR